MKKLILLTLFASTFAIARAQDSSTRIQPVKLSSASVFSQKTYRFTISVSPLISWLNPDSKNISSQGARMGVSGGLSVEKSLSENVAFTGGLYITQMGGKLGFDSLQAKGGGPQFNDVTYTYRTRYVEVPVLLKLRTDEFGYHRIYFEAGLALGFLWKARADVDKSVFNSAQGDNSDRSVNANGDDFNAATSAANEDNLFPFRMPLIGGVGWEYALSTNTVLFTGLRYNGGLLNVMSATNTKAMNSYVALNIGLLF